MRYILACNQEISGCSKPSYVNDRYLILAPGGRGNKCNFAFLSTNFPPIVIWGVGSNPEHRGVETHKNGRHIHKNGIEVGFGCSARICRMICKWDLRLFEHNGTTPKSTSLISFHGKRMNHGMGMEWGCTILRQHHLA